MIDIKVHYHVNLPLLIIAENVLMIMCASNAKRCTSVVQSIAAIVQIWRYALLVRRVSKLIIHFCQGVLSVSIIFLLPIPTEINMTKINVLEVTIFIPLSISAKNVQLNIAKFVLLIQNNAACVFKDTNCKMAYVFFDPFLISQLITTVSISKTKPTIWVWIPTLQHKIPKARKTKGHFIRSFLF